MDKKSEFYRHTADAWAEAFAIFAKYTKDDSIEIAAEYDTIYAGLEPGQVSNDDEARLAELGWHVSEDYDCYYHFD